MAIHNSVLAMARLEQHEDEAGLLPRTAAFEQDWLLLDPGQEEDEQHKRPPMWTWPLLVAAVRRRRRRRQLAAAASLPLLPLLDRLRQLCYCDPATTQHDRRSWPCPRQQ